MKTNKLFLGIVLMVIFSCEKVSEEKKIITSKNEEVKQKSFRIDNPILLFESRYIIYPIIFNEIVINRKPSEYFEGSIERKSIYSNFIFINSISNEYHLLHQNKNIIISFTSSEDDKAEPNTPSSKFYFNKSDKWLYYSVIIDDFNGDGKLDSNDPTYLFISNKKGKNFIQVSPKNVDIQNWRVIKETNKIIMEGKKDSNENKAFDLEDEVVPFTYVIGKDKEPKEILTEEFKKNLQLQ